MSRRSWVRVRITAFCLRVQFFPETPRIVAGATEFVLCAILSAGGVPFLRRGTEPYGVKPGAMKSILRLQAFRPLFLGKATLINKMLALNRMCWPSQHRRITWHNVKSRLGSVWQVAVATRGLNYIITYKIYWSLQFQK